MTEQIAFEISLYLFLGMILVGMGFIGYAAYWWFVVRLDPLQSMPEETQLPTRALDHARSLLYQLEQGHIAIAPERVARDIALLHRIIEELQAQTRNEQKKYYRISQYRSRLWHQLKQYVERMPRWKQVFGRGRDEKLQRGLEKYQQVQERLTEEKELAKRLDLLHLEQTKSRSLFQQYQEVMMQFPGSQLQHLLRRHA